MDRIELLKEVGVTVTHDYEYRGEPGVDRERFELPDVVKGVFLPFTAQEWCSMCMREPPKEEWGSNYVGGCCGNMSYVQDIMQMVFRDGGYIESYHFIEVGRLCRDHDGFDEFDDMDDEKFTKWIESFKKALDERDFGPHPVILDTWIMMGVIYNGVKDKLQPWSPGVPKSYEHEEEHPGQDIISLLDKTLTGLSWADLFTRDDDAHAAQYERSRVIRLAKLVEPAKALMKLLEDQQSAKFDGFAIVEADTDKPMQNQFGLCLYATEEQAGEVIEIWSRIEDHPTGEIVPCTVTLNEGVRIHRD